MSVINGELSKFRGGCSGFFGDDNPTHQPLTVSLNAGGQNIINLAAGTAATDAVNYSQLPVLDNTAAVPKYPIAPQTNGVWYGTGTKAQSAAQGATVVCLGNGAAVGAVSTVAVGGAANSGATSSVAVGYGAVASSAGGIALGTTSSALGSGNVAVGLNATSSGASGSLAVGSSSSAAHTNAICLGVGASSAKTGNICLGASAVANATRPGLVLYVPETVQVAAAGASDRYLEIDINGATYKLLLHT